MDSMELWTIEKSLYDEGFKTICGVDEAGRGPLAGPVCAAAVILPPYTEIVGLNDSKQLTAKKRDKLYDEIIARAEAYSVAFASEREIDELNILNATFLAMNRALSGLGLSPDMTLIDGNRNKGIEVPSRTVVGGDGKSANIAAASILAKVTRDRLMIELDPKYPQYGFKKHKGYGTKQHYNALDEHGPCEIHRLTFLKKYDRRKAQR